MILRGLALERQTDTLNRDADFVIAEFKECADMQLHDLG